VKSIIGKNDKDILFTIISIIPYYLLLFTIIHDYLGPKCNQVRIIVNNVSWLFTIISNNTR